MSNKFLEAARNSKDDSSKERYEKAKKEEAGTDHRSMAEKRYDELKEEAKKEFVEKQKERENEKQRKEEEESDEDSDSNFITY